MQFTSFDKTASNLLLKGKYPAMEPPLNTKSTFKGTSYFRATTRFLSGLFLLTLSCCSCCCFHASHNSLRAQLLSSLDQAVFARRLEQVLIFRSICCPDQLPFQEQVSCFIYYTLLVFIWLYCIRTCCFHCYKLGRREQFAFSKVESLNHDCFVRLGLTRKLVRWTEMKLNPQIFGEIV